MIADASSHGAIGLLVVAVVVLVYAGLSRRLANTVVSGPMVFVALGLLVGSKGLDLVDFSLSSELVRTVVEATLVLVLFSDASRIDLAGLRRHLDLPGRLLGIGLPLSIVAGVGAAALVYPHVEVLELALIAVILAPTDAALGQAVVTNQRLPAWVRQGLNVESGLNDGIAVPIFTTLTAFAVAETGPTNHALATELVRQLGGGLVCGVGVGLAGGWVLLLAHRRDWLSPDWTGIAGLLVAVVAYSAAVSVHGSGFIAAFCAGMAFGHMTRQVLPDAGGFGEQVGQLLEAITFVIFGGAVLTMALGQPSGRADPVCRAEPDRGSHDPRSSRSHRVQVGAADGRVLRLVRPPGSGVGPVPRAAHRGRAEPRAPTDRRRRGHLDGGAQRRGPRCLRGPALGPLRALVRTAPTDRGRRADGRGESHPRAPAPPQCPPSASHPPTRAKWVMRSWFSGRASP